MACYSCGSGFHNECLTECEECHGQEYEQIQSSSLKLGIANAGAPIKDNANVRDPHSTGRKRAAVWYPINRGDPCEWQGKKFCGGGLAPITGCIDGKQSDRHHGPIKDTLENTPGNVHRICKKCHNRWHAENDTIYIEDEYRKLPHSPQEASEDELIANEAVWRTRR